MTVAPIYISSPTYDHPLEWTLLKRLSDHGPDLVAAYIEAHSKDGVCFVSRDAAKTIFPEFHEDPVTNNRFTDTAASALADAVRRTLLSRPVTRTRNLVVILTGAPASGKTRSSDPDLHAMVELLHETIFTSLPRATELIEQTLAAGRHPVLRLFYTDDPKINVRRMIQRARTIGRTVPIAYMAKMYLVVPSIVNSLESAFGKSLSVRITNNSEGLLEAVDHNRIDRALYHVNRYNEKTALEALYAELDKIVRSPEGVPPGILEEALRV